MAIIIGTWRPVVKRMRVRQRGTLPMIDFFLSHPAASAGAAFAYMLLIWWMVEIYGGPNN